MDERRTALAFVGPSAAPLLLHSWWSLGEIGDDDLRSLLPGAWKGVEFPQRSLKRSRWSELFAAAGFVSEPPGLDPPSEALELYRGSTPGHARGLSWTTSRKRAEGYAKGWPSTGSRVPAVYVIEALPEAVVAIIQSGKDRDVVVDPSRIPKPRRA